MPRIFYQNDIGSIKKEPRFAFEAEKGHKTWG